MKFRNLIALILGVLLLLSLAGCSAASEKYAGSAAPNYGASDDYLTKEDASFTQNNTSGLPENRKLIQTVNMSVETENLDTVLQQINSRVTELKGYVENSSVQNGSIYNGRRYRNASLTIRIPAKDLDSFLDRVGEVTNIVSSQKRVEDVTLNYVATESRMKALQTEEARLLELMAKASNLNDLLTIEKRLTDVRTELEKVTSSLKVLDNQVDYATIHLSISEVKEYTEVTEPENLWERISVGFMDSLRGVGTLIEETFVLLVTASPYLVLMAVVVLVTVFTIRFFIRRGIKKRAKRNAQNNNPDSAT